MLAIDRRTRNSGYSWRGIMAVALIGWLAGCSGGSGTSENGAGTDTTEPGTDLALPDGIEMKLASKQITLTWPMQEDVTYDLYWSTDPDLDPDIATSNTMEPNISSPFVLSDLNNDQNYFAYLTVSSDDTTLTSARLDTRVVAPGVDRGNFFPGGGVTNLVQSNDGRLFIGGDFRMTGHGYGRLQALDDRFGYPRAHPQINNEVTAVAKDNHGGYFIATNYPVKILRVTANGDLDPTFNITVNNEILTMLVHGNTLYVGGDFTQIAGSFRDNLAAFSMNGDLLGWMPNPNREVSALMVHKNVLYIGGGFSNTNILNEDIRNYVAAFDLDNNRALTDWAPKINSQVRSLAEMNDHIVLGGNFSEVNDQERRRLAMVDTTGNLTDFNVTVDGSVRALANHNGWLYIGGGFTSPQRGIMRVDADGLVDENWPEHFPSNSVDTLLVTDNAIYAGGSFIEVGPYPISNLASYSHGGELETRIGYGVDQGVYDLELVDGRVVIASRAYIRVEGQHRGLAVLDWHGRWLDFPVTLDGSVQSLNIHQGNLYVGGSFTEVMAPNLDEPVVRSGAAAFSLDTADLQSFAPQISHTSFQHQVFNILPMDGDYLISGRFDSVNAVSRQGLARVDSQGANAGAIAGTTEANGRVGALALTNNHIYVAGSFEGFGGNANAKHIARIHRTGEDSGKLDASWLPNISNSTFSHYPVVAAIAEHQGLLYITGSFTQFNGSDTRRYTAVINTSNGNLAPWTAELSGPSWTYGIGFQYLPSENGFLITGTFTEVNGTETGRTALIKQTDATQDTTSNLGNALANLQQSSPGSAIDLNQVTGNLFFGIARHEEEERLRVGVYCMDSAGNLLW